MPAIPERTESTASAPSARVVVAPTTTPTITPRRTIASVRSKRVAQNTPSRLRAWVHPPTPREPNADERLAKLNHYNELKEHVQTLEKDEDIKEMTAAHRTKRVKIDDLVSIPHNRPGDPSSTFRVYDDDSEDEMEVDEAVELRKNVFEEVSTQDEPSPSKKQRQLEVLHTEKPRLFEMQEQEQPRLLKVPEKEPEHETVTPKKVQPPPQQKAATPPPPPAQTKVATAGELLHAQMEAGTPLEPHQLQVPPPGTAWVFPSAGKREEPYQEGTAQEARLGTIFKMAYDHWMHSGEIMPVF